MQLVTQMMKVLWLFFLVCSSLFSPAAGQTNQDVLNAITALDMKIETNQMNLARRLDEIEQNLVNIIALATTVDAIVDYLLNNSGGGGGGGSKGSKGNRRKTRERRLLPDVESVK